MNSNIETLRELINTHFDKIKEIKNLLQPQQKQQPLQNMKLELFRHYRYHKFIKNPSLLPELPEPPEHIKQLAKYEEYINEGGLTNVGVNLKSMLPDARIGTMVAGNSGRPGGACGLKNSVVKLHADHTTQEEDVISNWLITATYNNNDNMYNDTSKTAIDLFNKTINMKWGMENPEGADVKTIQGVDYTRADPYHYADAWVVPNAELSYKIVKPNNNEYDFSRWYTTTLVFVAGPNCGKKPKRLISTMRRTFNKKMLNDYNLFKEGVQAALFAGLCAMAENGCTIALLAYVSAGIYAGKHQNQLRKDFENLVNELLKKKCLIKGTNKSIELGRYFDKVILTKLK
jgi:hypothetical protein